MAGSARISSVNVTPKYSVMWFLHFERALPSLRIYTDRISTFGAGSRNGVLNIQAGWTSYFPLKFSSVFRIDGWLWRGGVEEEQSRMSSRILARNGR
ncbi:hypothetical protein AVEN_92473-1 [Araneus ventricosus]|uniref:Uncharacterized protein n=1 Tax=Araneus ventricosus TaxID=182803 RepID=A0A4Y2AHB4_ARAVE|nr:hypothetical protein AVEN_92473-1 [Araneus ventricosus]